MKKKNIEYIEDPNILKNYQLLKKRKENIWKKIADMLVFPRKKRIVVNLSKINRHTKENDIVVIPGKVVGYGLNKKINICALSFSEMAKKEIEQSNSNIFSFEDLINQNPKGTNVKILR